MVPRYLPIYGVLNGKSKTGNIFTAHKPETLRTHVVGEAVNVAKVEAKVAATGKWLATVMIVDGKSG